MSENTSRREFLKLAGKGVLGAAALSTVPAMLPALAEGVEAPAWPWAYKKLDKDAVMKHGYECFYSHGGCCAGAVAAVVELLAEEYGYPYNQLNARMFADGAGGYGAATLCGSLGGACAIFGLFCEANEARELRDQLYAWYKDHAFPSYQPEMESITTVSGAIECAVSVGNYMKATGYEMGDPGRKARCAAVTGETAAKAVELLNIHFGFEEAPAEEPKAEAALAENAQQYLTGHAALNALRQRLDGLRLVALRLERRFENKAPFLHDDLLILQRVGLPYDLIYYSIDKNGEQVFFSWKIPRKAVRRSSVNEKCIQGE